MAKSIELGTRLCGSKSLFFYLLEDSRLKQVNLSVPSFPHLEDKGSNSTCITHFVLSLK